MIRQAVLLALAATVLAGCSSDGENQRLLRETTALVLPAVAADQPPDPRYAALAAAGAPTLQMRRAGAGETITLRRLGSTSEGIVTWLTPQGEGLSFQQGVLVSVSGPDGNLMSSDVTQMLALMNSGADGQVKRFNAYLDGNDQIVTHSYICDVTQMRGDTGSVIREDCAGMDDNFINFYRGSRTSGSFPVSTQMPGLGVEPLIFGQGAS